jgi:hypothetical protein
VTTRVQPDSGRRRQSLPGALTWNFLSPGAPECASSDQTSRRMLGWWPTTLTVKETSRPRGSISGCPMRAFIGDIGQLTVSLARVNLDRGMNQTLDVGSRFRWQLRRRFRQTSTATQVHLWVGRRRETRNPSQCSVGTRLLSWSSKRYARSVVACVRFQGVNTEDCSARSHPRSSSRTSRGLRRRWWRTVLGGCTAGDARLSFSE